MRIPKEFRELGQGGVLEIRYRPTPEDVVMAGKFSSYAISHIHDGAEPKPLMSISFTKRGKKYFVQGRYNLPGKKSRDISFPINSPEEADSAAHSQAVKIASKIARYNPGLNIRDFTQTQKERVTRESRELEKILQEGEQ